MLSYHYGWTPETIDGLYWDDVLWKIEHAQEFRRDEYLMLLAVVTNPHIDSKLQGDLWNTLRGKTGKIYQPKTEAEVTAMLKGRKDGV